jgi:hypothetical protein
MEVHTSLNGLLNMSLQADKSQSTQHEIKGEWTMFGEKKWAIALHEFDPFGQYQFSLQPGEKLLVLGERFAV